MIVYLVAARASIGVEEAARREWSRIGAFRWATPARHDVRLVTRIADLFPQPGVTLMIKAPDYDEGPCEGDPVARQAWLGRDGAAGQRDEFDAFVAAGRGRWVADENDIPVNQGTIFSEGAAAPGSEF